MVFILFHAMTSSNPARPETSPGLNEDYPEWDWMKTISMVAIIRAEECATWAACHSQLNILRSVGNPLTS